MDQGRRFELGGRLRDCRVAAQLSVRDVATELGVSKQAVSAWENGSRTPDALRLGDLVLLYGVSADFILFGTHMVPDDVRAMYAKRPPPG